MRAVLATRPKRYGLRLLLAFMLLPLGCGDDDAGPDGGRDAATEGARMPEPHDGAIADGGRDSGGEAGRDAAPPADEDGGGDDDAGGDDAGVIDSPFYPVTDGSRWTYHHAGGANVWDEEVTISDSEYQGGPALLLADTPGPSGSHSESTLVRSGSRILRVHREEFTGTTLELTADYDPGFVRFDHAWATRPEGYDEVVEYHRIERDGQGQVLADGDRAHRYTVESRSDAVEVPAGRFEDCLRIRRSRVRSAGSPVAEGDEDLFWFCAGVGKVREEDQISGETEELVGCGIPNGDCP